MDISSTKFWTLLRQYFSSTWTLLRQYFSTVLRPPRDLRPYAGALEVDGVRNHSTDNYCIPTTRGRYNKQSVTDLARSAKSVTLRGVPKAEKNGFLRFSWWVVEKKYCRRSVHVEEKYSRRSVQKHRYEPVEEMSVSKKSTLTIYFWRFGVNFISLVCLIKSHMSKAVLYGYVRKFFPSLVKKSNSS